MNDYFKQYYNERKNDPEFMQKRRDAQRRYYMSRKENPKPKKTEYPHAITKEEWLRQYGYPMGDTTGWENWTGWDTRIRRGEEE